MAPTDSARWLEALHGRTSPHERYRRGRRIGQGPRTLVYEGHDRLLHRVVAIKVPRSTADGADAARLLLEAQITSQLSHPSIPAAYEVCLDAAGAPLLVMQRVRGRRLGDWRGAPLAVQPACEAMLAVAEAVGYAHERSVVHQDVRPANIVAGQHGETLLLDWGLAFHDEAAELDETVTSSVFPHTQIHLEGVDDSPAATPWVGRGPDAVECTAPECLMGVTSDALSDVYSLGACLAALVVGPGNLWDTPGGAAAAGLRGNRGRPRTVDQALAARRARGTTPDLARIPKHLRPIVERAMAEDAEDRYPTALHFADALRGFLYA